MVLCLQDYGDPVNPGLIGVFTTSEAATTTAREFVLSTAQSVDETGASKPVKGIKGYENHLGRMETGRVFVVAAITTIRCNKVVSEDITLLDAWPEYVPNDKADPDFAKDCGVYVLMSGCTGVDRCEPFAKLVGVFFAKDELIRVTKQVYETQKQSIYDGAEG
eukprot:scaffold5017_cov171-Amphora_coffeaeformis.AAC.23